MRRTGIGLSSDVFRNLRIFKTYVAQRVSAAHWGRFAPLRGSLEGAPVVFLRRRPVKSG
jgi:hypothetical protein